jgi:ribonuclease J
MDQATKTPRSDESLSFLPLGGIEDVTKNMYLYEYKDEILIVDCGLGFADETMLGVDLLLPDISYLLEITQQGKKRIVGMLLTHGHEDHIGALPFILPQLPDNFPIFATPFTAALANEKLKEFRIDATVKSVPFNASQVKLGHFICDFIRITHSVPDTANIFIKTPVGNFYHGSDFKFDLTPFDRKRTDFGKIARAGAEGILCLFSDSLGSERHGFTASEESLAGNIELAMRDTRGKFILTTYSSNIARINQTIQAAEKMQRKICFVGRSLLKAKSVAQQLGYLSMRRNTEISLDQLKKYKDHQLVLIVAGSQGQENSAMSRIANNEHKEIAFTQQDVIVFSSDTIPGNEISVNALIDSIAKTGAKVLYSDVAHASYHVSGHGSEGDIMLMMSLTNPRYLVPISGTYKHMVAYRELAFRMGYRNEQLSLVENGQEVLFSKRSMRLGRKISIRNVFVDQVSGEEIEGIVLRDRERLAKDGVILLLVEIDAEDGQLATPPEIITRGFTAGEGIDLTEPLSQIIKNKLSSKKGKVHNWIHMRKVIEEAANQHIFKAFRKRPLVLPVVIEV